MNASLTSNSSHIYVVHALILTQELGLEHGPHTLRILDQNNVNSCHVHIVLMVWRVVRLKFGKILIFTTPGTQRRIAQRAGQLLSNLQLFFFWKSWQNLSAFGFFFSECFMTPNQVALTWLLGDPHDYTMLITACQPAFPPFSHLLSSL